MNVQNRQIHKDKVDQWLPETGGGRNGKGLLMGVGVSFRGSENVVELDSGDGCTTL